MNHTKPSQPVILSEHERGTSEGESKDPDMGSPAMQTQGISAGSLSFRSSIGKPHLITASCMGSDREQGTTNFITAISFYKDVLHMALAPALLLLAFCLACPAQTAAPPQAPAPPIDKPSISLSPAVIMAKGDFGQSLTQTLTLTNSTGADLGFDLVAQDIIVKDGKRVFVPAGETPNGIAASAVFSPKSILIKAHTAGSVEVRLTIPAETNVRAVSAIFMGTDKFQTSNTGVAMTASLAALVTFNLTGNVKIQQDPAQVTPVSATENMKIAQWLANTGTEPVLPEGTAAILNPKGALVGKATFAPQRLLPGERLQFIAEYPEQLAPGGYRVLCSFQFEGKTLTSQADFQVQ